LTNFSEKVSFIWSVAGLLRGPYQPAQYKDVMLPLIDTINDRFGTDFTQADELFFHQLREEAMADVEIR
jgi:type I restriction-modification system DNA methylase subunit